MYKLIYRLIKISVIITVIIIFIDIIFSKSTSLEGLLSFSNFGIYFFYSFVLTSVNGLFFHVMNKRINWEGKGVQRVVIGVTGSIVLTIMTFFICRMIHIVYFEKIYSLDEFLAKERIGNYLFPLLFTAIVSLSFHLFYFYKALQEGRVAEQKIIAGTASAKFDALKNQLDPHFLFNSLNVLTSLIEENPSAAQKFTTSLSKTYRYVLEQKNKDLVELSEEIKFAKTYITLLKMRFEDGINCIIPLKLNLAEAKVVPLSLQLLLENAVKHNKVSPQQPLHIEIFEDKDELVVKNNLQKKDILEKGSKVGLFNIQQRYGLLTNRKVQINKSENFFEVRLPLLTKKTSVMEREIEWDKNKSYLNAKEKVAKLKGFYGNLTSYCVIIPALAIFNLLTSDFPWVFFPAIGWGIGVLFHGMEVFGYNPLLGKDWEDKKIKEFMERNKY
ncbi:2TM domain-containing protein [Gillisia hiemivivida]|uniref:Histidine kinase n=1 Tax=Gillisia hiemivivida TaxID=291190 RepID=A0A5C6ZY49_9FLAO|nr:2TM domain-containing protein [Gillisia hiemivivida]TXD95294.1 histidine kinase [Gillisia hiemivivida]